MNLKAVSLAALALAAVSATPACAQSAVRIWVSATGTDSATCGPVATPCRTFQWAHDHLASGGEIAVKDAGGYGPVTITKGVSIINDGSGTAGMAVTTGNAITINAGASDSVHIRGISIEGTGSAANGIVFNSGKSLTVLNSFVRHFFAPGVSNPLIGNGILSVAGAGAVSITVQNTVMSDNTGFGFLHYPNGPSVATVVVDHVIASNNNFGVVVSALQSTNAKAAASITNSIIADNLDSGISIAAQQANLATFSAAIESNTILRNRSNGIFVVDQARAYLANNTIMANGVGIANAAGANLFTYGDNGLILNNTATLGVAPGAAPAI